MMNDLQKIQKMGGVAALIQAATYMVGIGLALTLLAPVLDADPDQYVAFLADNLTLMHIWHLIIYLVNGVFLVVLVLALHERLKASSPAMAQTATAFGLIWAGLVIASGMLIINDAGVVVDLYDKDPAQAASVWLALSAVEEGLGGAIELPGGLWVLLLSWAALRTRGLPRALNYLGVAIGAAGILTVVPALNVLGAVFGLGFIVWFVWVGIVMLRSRPGAAYMKRPDQSNKRGRK
jgi:Domain of unknown function (DUF4386)